MQRQRPSTEERRAMLGGEGWKGSWGGEGESENKKIRE